MNAQTAITQIVAINNNSVIISSPFFKSQSSQECITFPTMTIANVWHRISLTKNAIVSIIFIRPFNAAKTLSNGSIFRTRNHSFGMVKFIMCFLRHYLKILNSIVKLVMIYMMNKLSRLKSSTKMRFHNKSMNRNYFIYAISFFTNYMISISNAASSFFPGFNKNRISIPNMSCVMLNTKSLCQMFVFAILNFTCSYHVGYCNTLLSALQRGFYYV